MLLDTPRMGYSYTKAELVIIETWSWTQGQIDLKP